MRTIAVVAVLALLIAACGMVGRPNYYPVGYAIALSGPVGATELRNIDDVVESLGFRLDSIPNSEVLPRRPHPDFLIKFWKLPSHQSTQVYLDRIESENSYVLSLTDIDTGGVRLVGEPCTKFLELSRALKEKFRKEPMQLKFLKDTC